MITTQRKGGRRQCFGEICKKSKILLGNKKRSTHVRQAGWPGTKSNTGTKQDILTFKTHISRTTFAWFTVLPLGLVLWQCCIFILINRNVAYHKNSKPKLLVRYLSFSEKSKRQLFWFGTFFWFFRSSPLEMFLERGFLKICRKLAGEHPCRSVICWNCTSAWVLFCKFAAYFQNTFSWEHL